ncbi:MAG: hypothetical protein RI513_02500 [Balneolaceae bacterium]|nr:hypothetical protein [Balneolaceae bacterium]
MARILKFTLLFITFAVILLGSIVWINRDAYQTLFSNREGMAEGSEWVEDTYSLKGLTEYIRKQPQPVSIVSQVVGQDSTLTLNDETPRPIGMLSSLWVLIALAEEIEQGSLDPDQELRWEDITTYQIPGVSEQDHEALEDALRSRAGSERGILEDQGEIVLTLDKAADLLPEMGDLALADAIIHTLGQEALQRHHARWRESFGWTHTEAPVPFSGIYLAMANGVLDVEADTFDVTGMITDSMMSQPKSRQAGHQWMWALSNAYGAPTREEEQQWRKTLKDQRLGINFMQERDALALFPVSTAKEMEQALESLLRREADQDPVAEQVMAWLDWPMNQSQTTRDFAWYGAQYDSRMGFLGGYDIGTSGYTGDTTVQVVLFDRLPVAFWFHLSANHMQQDYQQRLSYDPALIATTKRAIRRSESP